MNSFKKVVTLTLFLSLIASFVLYKADVFTFKKSKDSSEFIVSNFTTKKDSTDKYRRLIINYVYHLTIDTLKLTAEKSVIKTFTLETYADKILHGSKSPVLYKEYFGLRTKNKKIREKLLDLNIKRIRFTTNKVFEGIANDYDLNEVIELVENKTLKSHSSVEQHISNPKKIDFYWNRFKDYKIEINYIDNERGILVERKKVDKFLKWYSKFDEKRILDGMKGMEIMPSSKVIIVADLNEIDTPEYLEEKMLFKQKLKQYLNLKL